MVFSEELRHKILETFPNVSVPNAVAFLERESATLASFQSGEGAPKLFVYYQPRDLSERAELFLTSGEEERLAATCIYLLRTSNSAHPLAIGVVSPNLLQQLEATFSEVFLPILQSRREWGSSTDESVKDFLGTFSKFSSHLTDTVSSLQGGIELRRPDSGFEVENKPPAFSRAAADHQIVGHYETVLEDWCRATERLLAESEGTRKEGDDVGPNTELEFWRKRMAKLNSITEQLKAKECKTVLGVLTASKSRLMRKWKQIDATITDATNEAKDNVKYLSTLEKYTEPLYTGTPHTILEALPGLMNNIKMMHTIARYYSTTERMTNLMVKITNQMIVKCRACITGAGYQSLWDQPVETLLSNLNACLKLNDSYQEQYRITRDKLLTQPKGRQFDFNESAIFGKFESFCRRCEKLIDMFSTVSQFSSLADHQIDGMQQLIGNFVRVTEDFKHKPYDLLDHNNPAFDRDYIHFNHSINELESALQGFINSSFDNISNVEQALQLLKKFQTILQRDNLRADLDSKYMLIFQNYGLDLEAVQALYEKHKNNPPLVRNAPPVAGNIAWARQLLRRIEEPMSRFKDHRSLMASKESRKIVRVYNKVASALVEFESLWHFAWQKSIDAAKAGLNATLIIQSPDDDKLYVNFDPDILQLIRETKWLLRMNVEVPESARLVVLQEEKFKYYYDQLNYMLKEHERILGRITPITRRLLAPTVEDLRSKVSPGMTTLTWTSMNIDAFLHRVHSALGKVDELLNRINHIVDTKIERNLKLVRNMLLVDLSEARSYSLEQFVTIQDKHIRIKSELVDAKNLEVENAVIELIDVVRAFPLESSRVSVSAEAVNAVKQHYSKLMFAAILHSTSRSLNLIKRRIKPSASDLLTMTAPFFDVDIELSIPEVSINPSLEEIQDAINVVARAILQCSKNMYAWGSDRTTPGGRHKRSFHDELCQRKEIVKIILLLTGSIEGMKKKVSAYLTEFTRYDYLWKEDMQLTYSEFMRLSPGLSEFEAEIRKYQEIEQTIDKIAAQHNIGPLALETQSLKYSLKAEAAAWKAQYAKNLHQKAGNELREISNYIATTRETLQQEVKDLAALRTIMGVLAQIREREAEIDMRFGPVEDMYSLLVKYDVRLSRDESDAIASLRSSWASLRTLADDVNSGLTSLQQQFKRDLKQNLKSFTVDVIQFRNDYDANGPMVVGITPAEAMLRLNKFQSLFQARYDQWQSYQAGERLFGMPETDFIELRTTQRELQQLASLYSLYQRVNKTSDDLRACLWVDAKLETVMVTTTALRSEVEALPADVRGWRATQELTSVVDELQTVLPLLLKLSAASMRNRHWLQVMNVIGHSLNLDSGTLCLSHLLDAGLTKHSAEIEEITAAAAKEREFENKLRQIEEDWSDQVFSFVNYKERGAIALDGNDMQLIINNLEDSQVTLSAMMNSRHNSPFRDEVSSWLLKLAQVAEVIEQWLHVQSMWAYLEAVFSGGAIAKQLAQEAKRFGMVDKSWVKLMTRASETRNVIQACSNDDLRNLLPHMTEQLELCQKSLHGYLESKRSTFPRFYFVSDPVLLEILSSNAAESVQPHLLSIFDNIASVQLTGSKISSLVSGEGELVSLQQPVATDERRMEEWLGDLLSSMRATMRETVRRAGKETSINTSVRTLLDSYPAQVALLVLQRNWTSLCESAMGKRSEKGALHQASKKMDKLMAELVSTAQRDLSSLDRAKVETLLTIQMHLRDVCEEMSRHKVRETSDFEWQKRYRVYMKDSVDEPCMFAIADARFHYCYEYLGCRPRLVFTPLTERAYVTLTQALSMNLGGCPFGPAGTGKTETVKDLGKMLGKFVLVFNCSDQMDYRGMGKLFKGISQGGVWGCFDEINRIGQDVLSVAAQQIHSTLHGLRERRDTVVFTDGTDLKIDSNCGFFITMNPGYQGRTELPENLKSLFRNVAMMVPDAEIIMGIKLAAQGFVQAMSLAKKFATLYALCREQLSRQPHYDFGLRAILSVLNAAGQARRSACSSVSETTVLLRTLVATNRPKLLPADIRLFNALLSDIFGEEAPDCKPTQTLHEAVIREAVSAGLMPHDPWVSKVLELRDTMETRHGVMVVGPAGSGKTSCIRTLMGALTELGALHKEVRINPKSLTTGQLFGEHDPRSSDWSDGVFSAIWRKLSKPGVGANAPRTWIVLDGPVDALWIENMNSVMDDNRTLTLSNGDRLPMAETLKLVFEVEHLRNASPATVSRAGVVYIGADVLTWEPIVTSWLKRVPRRAYQPHLNQLFAVHWPQVVEWLDTTRGNVVSVCASASVTQATGILTTLLEDLDAQLSDSSEWQAALEHLFTFALTWSAGAVLAVEHRQDFHYFLANDLELPVPPEDTVYDHYVDDTTLDWEPWSQRLPLWQYTRGITFVPTPDTVRAQFLVNLFARRGKPVLLVGPTGSGKSALLQDYVASHMPGGDRVISHRIQLSADATPLSTQRLLESLVEKRQGRVYGPSFGRHLVMIAENINVSQVNDWGDQEHSELLRQLLECQGFYNLEKPGEWKSVTDLQWLVTMPAPGAGENDLPARLKRHFAVFHAPPSLTNQTSIYSALLAGHCRGTAVTESACKVAEATIALVHLLAESLPPVRGKEHYRFNLNDVHRIIAGVMRVTRQQLVSEDTLVRVWRHEAIRSLRDKLVSDTDAETFDRLIHRASTDAYGAPMADRMAAEPPTLFADFLACHNGATATGSRAVLRRRESYEPHTDIDAVTGQLKETLRRYNEKHANAPMSLVLFTAASQHVVRIARVLSAAAGHLMLIGPSGSGKGVLTRLAAYATGYAGVSRISLTKSYNKASLLEELKGLMVQAGVQNVATIFSLSDYELSDLDDPTFLEPVHHLLATGDVPNLWAKDEMDIIIGELRTQVKREDPGFLDTADNLQTLFKSRVSTNLRIVLSFDADGAWFASSIARYPSFLDACAVNVFAPWPLDALRDVATTVLADVQLDAKSDDADSSKDVATLDGLAAMMATSHQEVQVIAKAFTERFHRRVYVTPETYLNFLATFKHLHATKTASVAVLRRKLSIGLSKLNEAADVVGKMRAELTEQETFLLDAQNRAQELLQSITSSTARAERKKSEIAAVRNRLAENFERIEENRRLAEEDLSEARPALEKAVNALSAIKASDISTLRRLPNPPDLTKRIMDCVLILRRRNGLEATAAHEVNGRVSVKDSYSAALAMMAESNFLKALLTFDKATVNEETIELLQPYMDMPDFTLDDAKRQAASVAGIFFWVQAMCVYYKIAKNVTPLIDAVQQAEARADEAKGKLAVSEGELEAIQSELDAMKVEFDSALAEKHAIQERTSTTRKRLDTANAVITGLASERARWADELAALGESARTLAGNVVVSAAFLAYGGPFNQAYRSKIIGDVVVAQAEVARVPLAEQWDVSQFLGDAATCGEWHLQGLPRDPLSVSNALLVTHALKWPLLIDPEGQASRWLVQRERERGIIVTSQEKRNFWRQVEEALAEGKPLLIDNVVGTLDPALDPLLTRQTFNVGRSTKLSLNGRDIDYNDAFRLYLVTREPNPAFSAELASKATIINFTVTTQGLEAQLLGRVVSHEKGDLETRRAQLLNEINDESRKVVQLEDELLMVLSHLEGNILDNPDLVDVLGSTKKTVEEVKERMAHARATEEKLDAARQEYMPVARRAASLYTLVREMSGVNKMYETSLDQFLVWFERAMKTSERAPQTSRRIANIIDTLTYLVYTSVSVGLFSADRPLFALLMALKVDLSLGNITQTEFITFARGGATLDPRSIRAKPQQASWMPDRVWLNLHALTDVEVFARLPETVVGALALWKAWYEQEAPETTTVPNDALAEVMQPLHRLMLVRAMREDRVVVASTTYIADTLGQAYTESVSISMPAVLAESTPCMPVIWLLSPGSDPASMVEQHAKKRKVALSVLSLGQGQEQRALALLTAAATSGAWVMLQNCHLGLASLRKVMTFLANATLHKSFRLWLTTREHEQFPVPLLHCSLKLTADPPRGVKASLKQSYSWLGQDVLELVERSDWPVFLYAICYMHSVLQERRKFGALGWTQSYEFNRSDVNIAIEFLQNHFLDIGNKGTLSWATIRYMIGEVIYGGKVTDPVDRRLLMTYVDTLVSSRILERSFTFPGGYRIPSSTDAATVRAQIDQLPLQDHPELFGLHANADITHRVAQTTSMLATILAIQPTDAEAAVAPSAAGEGGVLDVEAAVLALIAEVVKKLPDAWTEEYVRDRLDRLGAQAPYTLFIAQEVAQMQAVLACVRATFADITAAVAGDVAFQPTTSAALKALHDGAVPPHWPVLSWTASSLAAWLAELQQRFDQLNAWLKAGRPRTVWLGGFRNPQGFLTALKQEVTRMHPSWTLDDVVIAAEVTDKEREQIKDQPSEGVLVTGHWLEGAAWDKSAGRLVDSPARTIFSPLPVIHVTAVPSGDKRLQPHPNINVYTCPVYQNAGRSRASYVFDLNLKCDELPAKWMLRGVALLCSKEM